MLKKARAERDAAADKGGEKELAKSVLDSSRQIWLAGLGAFSRAQAEGMKVFEDRVARALSRLGVHTQSDVDRLAARVDALAEAVNQLTRASGGKPVRESAPAGKTTKRRARTAKKVARAPAE